MLLLTYDALFVGVELSPSSTSPNTSERTRLNPTCPSDFPEIVGMEDCIVAQYSLEVAHELIVEVFEDILAVIHCAGDIVSRSTVASVCLNLVELVVQEEFQQVVKLPNTYCDVTNAPLFSPDAESYQEKSIILVPGNVTPVNLNMDEVDDNLHGFSLESLHDTTIPDAITLQPAEVTSENVSEKDFERVWNKRKAEVEKGAELRAGAMFRQWKRERINLESAIESSLKEYGELYEKAHAIRLLFEEEKRNWAAQVADSYRKEENNKRQIEGDKTYWNLSRQSLPNEFEYCVDDDEWIPASRDDTIPLITPLKKALKRFTVPLKGQSI